LSHCYCIRVREGATVGMHSRGTTHFFDTKKAHLFENRWWGGTVLLSIHDVFCL